MEGPYRDRRHAAAVLAEELAAYAGRGDVVVLGLPRGGVPIACDVADALGAHVDLLVVRKLGVPGHGELAMGAIASGGIRILNEDVLAAVGARPEDVEDVARREEAELLRRESAYRDERPRPDLAGRTVILVDDGLATGATMRAAVAAVRQAAPARVVVAVPVAPADTIARLRSVADEIVCPRTPDPFYAIGEWYHDFSQVEDGEVRARLARSWRRS